MFAIVLSIIWLLFFYYYHHRALPVSDKHLQHEFHASKYSWDRVHLQHSSYTGKQKLSSKNDSLNFVRDIRHFSSHARENSHAENVSHLYVAVPLVPNTVHNDSHIHATDAHKDANQRQDVNDAARMLPGWLRWDPSLQQLLRRQNISRSIPKLEVLDDVWTTAKPVLRPMKPVGELLLASGHKLSGHFVVDVRHAADTNKQIAVSVVDSGFADFAVNFQRLSIDTVGLRNFLFVCTDHEAVTALQQHGIACSYYHKSARLQVTESRVNYTVMFDRLYITRWLIQTCGYNFWQVTRQVMQNCDYVVNVYFI